MNAVVSPQSSKKPKIAHSLNCFSNSTEANNFDITNPSYWYSDQDINDLLNILISQNQKVNILLAPNDENMFVENLQRAIGVFVTDENEQGIINPDLPSFMPLHINYEEQKIANNNNHWIGLYLQPINNLYKVVYVDSAGKPLPNYIRQQVEKVIDRKLSEFLDKSIRQQNNPNDCGAFLVDNFNQLAKKQELRLQLDQKADILRVQHAELLANFQHNTQSKNIINTAIVNLSSPSANSCALLISNMPLAFFNSYAIVVKLCMDSIRVLAYRIRATKVTFLFCPNVTFLLCRYTQQLAVDKN